VRASSTGAVTVSGRADFVTEPRLAEIVATLLTATPVVVTLNVAVAAPPDITGTLPGTIANAESDPRVTVMPPAGTAPLK
jgi:hypothetical protein